MSEVKRYFDEKVTKISEKLGLDWENVHDVLMEIINDPFFEFPDGQTVKTVLEKAQKYDNCKKQYEVLKFARQCELIRGKSLEYYEYKYIEKYLEGTKDIDNPYFGFKPLEMDIFSFGESPQVLFGERDKDGNKKYTYIPYKEYIEKELNNEN